MSPVDLVCFQDAEAHGSYVLDPTVSFKFLNEYCAPWNYLCYRKQARAPQAKLGRHWHEAERFLDDLHARIVAVFPEVETDESFERCVEYDKAF